MATLGRLRQEDCCELKANLCHLVSTKTVLEENKIEDKTGMVRENDFFSNSGNKEFTLPTASCQGNVEVLCIEDHLEALLPNVRMLFTI